jgi:TonB-dependent starch-binding outer membrane protein SusC
MALTAICNQESYAQKNQHSLRRFITTSTEGRSGHSAKLSLCRGQKLMRVMQLTAAFLLIFGISVSAKSVSQTISISEKNISLENIFTRIEKQTNYVVAANYARFNVQEKVSVDVKDMPIDEFMLLILKNKPFTFEIKSKTIFIKDKTNRMQGLNPKADLSPSLSFVTPPITGIVRSPDGQPIVGANVVIKGTKKGTVTGRDGSFKIEANDGEMLVVSSIGYTEKQLAINNGQVGFVILNPSESKLDEVQIIAYGTTSRRLNTGNLASVKSADISKQPVQNPLQALVGRVPGLQITQATGLPGSGFKVRIQGQNSIAGGNDPFYVIDGVPYTSQLLPGVSSILGTSGTLPPYIPAGAGNPLSFINPADIESIDVLKDADATAIYGSRASNGAILITTKKGKAGKTTANISWRQGYGEVMKKLKLLNTEQYLAMRKEAYVNDGLPVPDANTIADGNNYDLTLWDQHKYTDWQKLLIGNTAKYLDINAGISGGTGNTNFLISGGYKRETSVFLGDFADAKGSLHFSLGHSSADQRFKINLTGSYMTDKNQLPGFDLTEAALTMPPNAPDLFNADGSLNWAPNAAGSTSWGAYATHPVARNFNKNTSITNNLLASSSLSYEIIRGLAIKTSVGYSNLDSKETLIFPHVAVAPERRATTDRFMVLGNNTIRLWNIDPQLSYQQRIGKGKVDVLFGGTIQKNTRQGLQLYAVGYSSDDLLKDIKLASSIILGSSIQSEYNHSGLFGRINYEWKDKYIVNLTGRRDGSSRFGTNNLFHNFGAIGAAWIFSDEQLIKDNFTFLSFGKLKGSYGSTGNDQIGDYRFLNLYSSTGLLPYQGVTGAVPGGLPNPYLQWELTRKLHIGIDLGFLNSRLLFNAGYSRNTSSNQLLNYSLPMTTGFGDISSNFPATIENTNWEFVLNAIIVKNKSTNWTANVNITLPKNKLIAFPGLAESTYSNSLLIGQPMTILQLYQYAGVDPATGLYQVMGRDGKLTSDPRPSYLPDNDLIALLNPDQKFYGGFQNTINYKRFELDVLFQFVKQKGRDYSFGNVPGLFYASSGNQPVEVLSRWQKPGDLSSVRKFATYLKDPPFVSDDALSGSNGPFGDASYIRLKNLSLSWQVPENWLSRMIMQRANVYIQCQNLLTITSYKGLDPENQNIGSVPPLRIISFGIQVYL